jgi:two-component system response regulator
MKSTQNGSSGSYDLGVNSYITKPATFGGLVEAMRVLRRYWFGIVELPTTGNGA